MIYKLVGAGLIVGAAGWSGLSKANRLARRTAGLRRLRLALNYLEKEIGYARNPLPQALQNTARVIDGPEAELFAASARVLASSRNASAQEAWTSGMSELRRTGIFTGEDLAMIGMLGGRIGGSDAPDQVQVLELAAEELRVQEEKARETENNEKNLWIYGGFLSGTLISILLI